MSFSGSARVPPFALRAMMRATTTVSSYCFWLVGVVDVEGAVVVVVAGGLESWVCGWLVRVL